MTHGRRAAAVGAGVRASRRLESVSDARLGDEVARSTRIGFEHGVGLADAWRSTEVHPESTSCHACSLVDA